MNKMDQVPGKVKEANEKAAKLKETLTQDQLYTIADALMRLYFGQQVTGNLAQERAKIKKLLKLVTEACPDAEHYLDDM